MLKQSTICEFERRFMAGMCRAKGLWKGLDRPE
jgi:hypothetical protein